MSEGKKQRQTAQEGGMPQKRSSTLWYAGIFAVGHFTVDAYANFLAPLLFLLVDKLGLSPVAVGGLASILGLSTSLIQPLFGYWADRMGGKWMIVASVVLAAIFFSLIGLAPNYATLALFLTLGGIGVAAFHPQGAAMTGKASLQRRGLGMSIFTTGGTLGFALSPVIVASVADQYGLESILWMAIPGLFLSLLFYKYTPSMEAGSEKRSLSLIWSGLRQHLKPLVLLDMVVIIRAAVSIGFMTFLPLLLKSRNISGPSIGSALSLYLFAGAAGGIFGGHLSDRFGRRTILLISLICPVPFLFYLPSTHGLLFLICLSFSGSLLLSSVPVNVVMAQELAPHSAATVSSLMMGLGWGLGSLILIPFGAISDVCGLEWSLKILGCLPLLAALCVPFIYYERQADEPLSISATR